MTEKQTKKPFKFRGKNTFYFKRKRYPIPNLRGQRASIRVSNPGGGGSFDDATGDGEAWHKNGDMLESGWMRKRIIKAGQWFGWWKLIKISDIDKED